MSKVLTFKGAGYDTGCFDSTKRLVVCNPRFDLGNYYVNAAESTMECQYLL